MFLGTFALAAALVVSLGCETRAPAETPTLSVLLMDGIGSSALTITTSSELAQKYFNQGLNLLHCFWDFEAHRAFKEAVRLDPDAPMPYWGLFLSLNYNQREELDERRLALAKMEELKERGNDREKRYIEAVLRLNREGGQAGQAAFIDEMEKLIAAYPDEIEAKLFLVKFLITESGGYFTSTAEAASAGKRSAFERAEAILRDLFEEHAESAAVHHYWIHVHEYGPTPEAAVPSAVKLPLLAPHSGHILHMPGHIYYQIGEYDKAYESFKAGLAFDQGYMEKNALEPVDNWNYVHNIDYLVANCSEDGRYAEGQRWGRVLEDLPSSPHRSHAVGRGFVIYAGRSALARLHMRYGHWAEARASLERILIAGDPAQGDPAARYLAGLGLFTHGMASLASDDLAQAEEAAQHLLRLSVELREATGIDGADWYFEAARRILAIAAFELVGSLASERGEHEQAIKRLEEAVRMEESLGYWEPPHYARPIHQSLAQAYLRAGRIADARRTYERELERRPQSGHALFGIAQTFAQEGNFDAARQSFERFLSAWKDADTDLPQLRFARDWLAADP